MTDKHRGPAAEQSSAGGEFDARLRGGLEAMARDAERSSDERSRTAEARRDWTAPLMVAAAVVAVIATGAFAAGRIGGDGDGRDPAPAATATTTEATTTETPTGGATGAPRSTVPKGQVDSTAEKVTAFENLPGFARAGLDYESREVEVLWKGTVPAGLASLRGKQPNGVVVVIKSAEYSAADLDAAGRRLFNASSEERDGAAIATTAGNGDYSGLVVEIVKPWSGSTDKLAAIAGVPVEVVLVDEAPVPLDLDLQLE